MLQKSVWNIQAAAAVMLHPDGSAGLQVYTWKTQGEEADALGSGFVEYLVGTGGCLISILIAKRLNTDRPPLERWEMWEWNQISWETKRHPLKSIHIHADWQTDKATPTGSPERKRLASTPHVVTTKQAKARDFKAAMHKHHTQGLSETSPVMWLQARCTQTGSLAKQRGRCPCQSWSAANQKLPLLWGGCFGGLGHLPDWLSTCCSPICPPAPHDVTTGLSFTLL